MKNANNDNISGIRDIIFELKNAAIIGHINAIKTMPLTTLSLEINIFYPLQILT